MSAPDLVPLATAVLCMDCERISAPVNGGCPGCQSAAVMSLANILDREMNQALKDLRKIRETAPAVRRIFDFVSGGE